LYRRRPMNHPIFSRSLNIQHMIMMLVIMLALSGCSLLPVEGEALQPPLIQPTEEEFDFVEVAKGNIQTFLRGTANFVASNSEALSYKTTSGRLKSINVTVGQEVEAGDLLVELETGDLEHQINLQRLNVERKGLEYKKALIEGSGPIDLRLREINLEQENMVLDSMESRFEDSLLYSPITGIVTFVEKLDTGGYINAYQSIITVVDPTSMQLTYIAIDSKEIIPIQAGMPATLKYRGQEYTGKVLQSPSNAPIAADNTQAESNAVKIIVGMDKQPEGVQIGHSAELVIELQKRDNVIVLPRSALRSYMGRNYVQIAEGERRKEVDVEVGLVTPTEVEIVKGLEEGQKVILNN
jgi:multidrug efflux pump subunit AcrA (membrane-fusion protein)